MEDRGLPLNRKLGYDHMLEMRVIENELRASGITERIFLHFEAVRRYEEKHRNDPSYRERNEAWKLAYTIDAGPSDFEILKRALEEIRDGHNDPRLLAKQTLDAVAPTSP